MGGSGGSGGPYFGASPDELKQQIKSSSEELEAEFRPTLQALLDEQLSAANDRDIELVNARREEIKNVLKDELQNFIDLSYGGSVAKHTYVDGISDVDAMLVLREGDPDEIVPSEVKETVAERLAAELPHAKVSAGRIAVTIEYPDGPEIQIIPALRFGNSFRVPSWSEDTWSRINPATFTAALTRRNQQCQGKMIPTIKLTKAVNATLPESQQLSGYHIESLAIDAFRNYEGTCTTSHMLPFLLDRISERVLRPIKDSTGQSINADEYLGRSRSDRRKRISHVYGRLAKRMRTASAAKSEGQWLTMFDSDS